MTNGKAAMAYKGEVPWHGLGNNLKEGATLEQWKKAAGMNWNIGAAHVIGKMPEIEIEMPETKMLFRDDTLAPLSLVSNRYKVVQPGEVLEFFRDLVSDRGMTLETAGCLRGGRRFWALANTGLADTVTKKDEVKAYVLLSTSCDGSLSTRAQFTSVRVVCQNTLSMATAAKSGVSVRHSSEFDAKSTKLSLGLAEDTFGAFMEDSRILAKKKVSELEAKQFFADLVNDQAEILTAEDVLTNTSAKMFDAYKVAPGQDMLTAQGTAWGLVNAVTYYYDHARNNRDTGARLNRAWFGDGARAKRDAWNAAKLLAGI